ncbi:hypothetical protein CH75_01675 [Dyella jiangningensis]|jgi:hypothetical protein|uniref:hypothetical protein n=1 Tax=Dyella jiangningensis TaxID=1379159 RepID=UPI0004562FBE|nr:hypothetical protein [Dyella jiangningensis]AHX16090.1 hypothetical protein CH75_01675 [Dyella jiangningensis]MDG2537023.1 hypothetical protein [Dyella jiangningensis]
MRKLFKLACLVALAWSASFTVFAAAIQGPCRLIDPSTCADTKELARTKGFMQELAHFIGDEKASYFSTDRTVSSQAMSAFNGAPDGVTQLTPSRYLFAACPERGCDGSAAAIMLNEYGQIKGLVFSSFHCATGCEDYRHVDIYMRKDDQDDAVLAALKAWATSDKLRKTMSRPDADEGIDKRMDVHLLP